MTDVVTRTIASAALVPIAIFVVAGVWRSDDHDRNIAAEHSFWSRYVDATWVVAMLVLGCAGVFGTVALCGAVATGTWSWFLK